MISMAWLGMTPVEPPRVQEIRRYLRGVGKVREPRWLDRDVAIDVHAEQLALFGGAEGTRDRGLLESALARPVNKFNDGESDIAALAAVCACGMARNHPFVDGK